MNVTSPPERRGEGERRRPGCVQRRVMNSLAAVGVNHICKELHAHDGKGVVEDDQGQPQTSHPGEELKHGVQHVAIPLLYLK